MAISAIQADELGNSLEKVVESAIGSTKDIRDGESKFLHGAIEATSGLQGAIHIASTTFPKGTDNSRILTSPAFHKLLADADEFLQTVLKKIHHNPQAVGEAFHTLFHKLLKTVHVFFGQVNGNEHKESEHRKENEGLLKMVKQAKQVVLSVIDRALTQPEEAVKDYYVGVARILTGLLSAIMGA